MKSKVIILTVLLISWLEDPEDAKTNIEVIEYFAGAGMIAQLAGRLGYVSCGYDLEYGEQRAKQTGRRNSMDLNSNAGFILAVKLILRGSFNNLVGLFAVVCSSFVPVNRGTGSRDIMVPEGNEQIPSVRRSNKLVSRKLAQKHNNLYLGCSDPSTRFSLPPALPQESSSQFAAEECDPHAPGALRRRGDWHGEPQQQLDCNA